MRLVPEVEIAYDGDCRQSVGVDMPVAVINLAHRTDKWDAVSSRMRAVGLDKLIKVPAVEGARLSLPALAPLLAQSAEIIEAPPASHFTLTRPAVGCFLSHLAVWRWMIDSGVPRMIVLEDDATPFNFDPARFRSALGSLPPETRMLLLGRIIMNGMAEAPGASGVQRIYFFNGTFAYLITPAACRTLVPLLVPLDGHIDHQISMALIAQRHSFAAHYIEPPFFEPDWSLRSDCYVPLEAVTDADRALGDLLNRSRQLLVDDGRPLQPPF